MYTETVTQGGGGGEWVFVQDESVISKNKAKEYFKIRSNQSILCMLLCRSKGMNVDVKSLTTYENG